MEKTAKNIQKHVPCFCLVNVSKVDVTQSKVELARLVFHYDPHFKKGNSKLVELINAHSLQAERLPDWSIRLHKTHMAAQW